MRLNPINLISLPNSFSQATDFLSSNLTSRIALVAGVVLAALGIAFLLFYTCCWKKKEEGKTVETKSTQEPVVKEKTEAVVQKTILAPQPTTAAQLTPEVVSQPTPEPIAQSKSSQAPVEQLSKGQEKDGKTKREDMLTKAIERWADKDEDALESTALENELTTLATAGNEEDYYNFVTLLVEKVKESDLIPAYEQAAKLLDRLSVDQFGELTKVIFAKSSTPWALVLDLIKIYIFTANVNKEKVNRILDEKLSSLEDEEVLEELYSRTSRSDTSDICKKLSLDQVDKLIKRWKSYGYYSSSIFEARDDRKELVDRFAKNEVDLEEFIRFLSLSGDIHTRALSGEVSGWAILRVLNSTDSEDVKKKKIQSLLPALTQGEDAIRKAVVFLADHCPAEHIRLVLLAVRERSVTSRETQEFLLALLRNPNPEKIRNAFSAFWTFWKDFANDDSKVALVILPYIGTRAILEAVYQAIPNDNSVKKAEIVEHLKKTHQHKGDSYKIGVTSLTKADVLG